MTPPRSLWYGLAVLLGGFAALCSIFAGVVTAIEGWREHVQAGWPLAGARVEVCAIRHYESRGRWYYIRCRINYPVRGETVEAQIDSRNLPAPERVFWQSSSAVTYGDFQSWVEAHPPGSTIDIHYDPADPTRAVLVVTDMPLAGPKTPENLQLLGGFALGSVVLLAIGAAGWRPRRAA